MPLATHFEQIWQIRQPLIRLLRLLRAPWFAHLGYALVHIGKALPLYAGPLFVAEIVRLISLPEPPSPLRFWLTCGIFGLMLVGNIPFNAWYVSLTSRRTRALEHRLRHHLVRHFQYLSIGFHNDTETGRLQTRVLRDVELVINLTNQLFNNGLTTVLAITWALGYTLATEPLAALIFLVLAPVAAVVIRLFRSSMRRRNRALRQRVEGMAIRVTDMIHLIPVTRAHGLEEYEIADVDDRLQDVRDEGHRVDRTNGWFQASAWVTMHGSLFLILIGSAWICMQGYLTVAEVILYHGLFAMIVGNLNMILNMFPQLARGFESLDSLGEILTCPDVELNRGKRWLDHVEGGIRFDRVTFAYRDQPRPAVQDFDLDVRPGECIAVVGESGSGKSTLMNLTIGFWRPTGGRILLDGVPQEDIDLRSWRRQVAVVPQQTVLFSGNLRENICYGLPDIDDSRLQAAISAANLEAVIADLPEGLETRIGENGVKLSGGQRQRVAIARAIVRDPRIIILDEATSALDVIAEREVQKAIDRLIAGRTTFIVAHRLSTIRKADRVVVMRDGNLAECGAHDDLLERGGAFAELKALQE